ncbi:MAG: sigma-70 family RNA polymerase sigma factor [Myxococcota bacterium]
MPYASPHRGPEPSARSLGTGVPSLPGSVLFTLDSDPGTLRASGNSRTSIAMAEPQEAELLKRAQAGDRGAFGRLVRLHQRRVYACAVQMLGDRGEAEDAVQDAFLRAWRAIERFDGRSELSTWLYRICVNVCLNTLRKRRRVKASDIQDPRIPEPAADPLQGGTDPGAATEQAQLYQRLGAALDQLSPSLRTTVVLVLIQGMPHKQAAEVLGCPEGTVAWRIHEARRRLHSILSPERESEPAPAVTERSAR